jgi:predicted kinase
MRDETRQVVVLVVGRPATGKTTVSREIAARWGLPLVAKDHIKELLFDSLGTGDREWSRAVGRASFSLLDYVVERQLRGGGSFVVDAAYRAEHENERFRAWQQELGFVAVQVHCRAAPDELLRRFVARANDGTRHRGHGDAEPDAIEEFRLSLADERPRVFDLRGPVLDYDSSHPDAEAALLLELGAVLAR